MSYTTRDVAQILGLSESQVRSFVRAGFLEPERLSGGRLAFSFPDLVFLRAARGLADAGVPPRRVKSSLAALRQRLPPDRDLAGVRLSARGDTVVVSDAGGSWRADSGQALLDFDAAEPGDSARPARPAPIRPRRVDGASGERDPDAWFALAAELESSDPEQAMAAYNRVLELEPGRSDALVNLGRLLHEGGDAEQAAARYRSALDADPADATAAFNLGVALEDLGRRREALDAYRRALELDPSSADAHYNAARLLIRLGETPAALRHLQQYRRLTGAS